MPSPYDCELSNDQNVVVAGSIAFTNPGNQPADVNQPFRPEPDAQVTVVEDSAGDPAYVYDDDGGIHNFSGLVIAQGGLDAGNNRVQNVSTPQTNGDAANKAYVDTILTVISDPPVTFLTPLVFDDSAVTGGLYAWDSAAYVKVGGVL